MPWGQRSGFRSFWCTVGLWSNHVYQSSLLVVVGGCALGMTVMMLCIVVVVLVGVLLFVTV